MAKDRRRTRLYNVRLSSEEDARFKGVADHHNLNVSQLLRTLVARAARGLDETASAAERADSAWLKAHASFLETGVAETLGRIIVNHRPVRATLTSLDRVIADARESGESDVQAAMMRFREAVSAFPSMHGKERAEHVREYVELILAYADASQHMFAWVTRRGAI